MPLRIKKQFYNKIKSLVTSLIKALLITLHMHQRKCTLCKKYCSAISANGNDLSHCK